MAEPYIEILDQNGTPITVPYSTAIQLAQQQTALEDREIGLQRPQIPITLITLPDVPAAMNYMRFSRAMERVSTFAISAVEADQALMMRCVRCYWNAKAAAFPNLLYHLISDPTADGALFSQTLPSKALENLRIDLAADKALYDLLQYDLTHPQASAIKAWLTQQDIDYAFTSHRDYFLHILATRFKQDYEEVMYLQESYWESKRNNQQFYRQNWKYLSNIYDPEEDSKTIQACEASLRGAGWEGYALLALRASPKQGKCKTLKRLWKNYLKSQRATLKFLDTALHWKNCIPYQHKKTNDGHPMRGVVTDEGYIYWIWA